MKNKRNERTYGKAIWSTAKYAMRLQPWEARDFFIYMINELLF